MTFASRATNHSRPPLEHVEGGGRGWEGVLFVTPVLDPRCLN